MPVPENHTLSLHQTEAEAWQLLVNGSQNPKDGFYTGVLGTQTATGVSLRTVVLREADPVEKTLICYSDVRAAKVQEIRQQARVSYLFWDSEKKIQLRLTGKAAIHASDPLAHKYWEGTSLSNRRSYLAIATPGAQQLKPSSGLPEGLDSREPTQEESERGKSNFAVIITHIEQIDWLFLNNNGHRRASFTYQTGKLISLSWITP